MRHFTTITLFILFSVCCLTACSDGGGNRSSTAPDFDISVSAATLTFNQVEQSESVTIDIKRNNNFSETVAFSVDTQDIPSGIGIDKVNTTANQATFTIRYDALVPAEEYTLTFRARAGETEKTTVVILNIQPASVNSSYS